MVRNLNISPFTYCWFGLIFLAPSFTYGDGLHDIPDEIIVIHGKKSFKNKGAQVGRVDLQSDGIGLLRPGSVLEAVPGMIVSQHSGSGKANQYFLRGFNLDHGTDFATSVDGIPVNARSHGHGQGYTDLNFLLPELLASLDYQKGPGDVKSGDFASAGSAQMTLLDQIDPQVGLTIGPYGFRRLFAGGTSQTFQGNWINGLEIQKYDGPWQGVSEDIKKYNLWSRYSEDTLERYFSLTLMAYQNQWNAADQIPSRLLNSGFSRFYAFDEGTGGESYRYSVSADWQKNDWKFNVYALQSRLDLWSDFTYFLDNPVDGDQFYQLDERRQFGGELSHQDNIPLKIGQLQHQYGVQLRVDKMSPVELSHTKNRRLLDSLSSDRINQQSTAIFSQQHWLFTDRLSFETGVRYDWMEVDVRDLLSNIDNQEQQTDGIASLRGGVTYEQNSNLWSLRLGQGFHSNDARVVVEQSPNVNFADNATQPIWSRTRHLELAWQTTKDRWQHSASIWQLLSEQELVYVADAGETELKGASRRHGIEGTINYYWNHQWSAGLEYALTKARLDDSDEGRYIVGSVPRVFAARLQYHSHNDLEWQLKVRHLGSRPLDANAELRSEASTQLSMMLSGVWQELNWRLELHNALNSKTADIEYFYESRLFNEPEIVADKHVHPLEPRMLRINITYMF